MSVYFGITMCVIILPTLLIMFYIMYPKKWQDKKMIFGVKNRPEYKEEIACSAVESISAKYRKWALGILVACVLISLLLLLMHGFVLQTTVWCFFVLVSILAINVPYFLGNKEMKDLKRRMGITSQAGINLVDLTNVGTVHALKPMQAILPNVVALLSIVFVLLVDLKVIPWKEDWYVGTFLLTGVFGSFFLIGIMVTLLAVLMDRLRNEVISADRDVNANYNRAKKKNMADFMVLFLWINVLFSVLGIPCMVLAGNDLYLLILMAVYMAFIMIGVAVFARRNRTIEKRYNKEVSLIADDDDHWILGQFYYNPQDKRLNVEKRVGVGGTVNFAHPVGKILAVILLLMPVYLGGIFIWLGLEEATPIQLSVRDNKVICHQLRDDYVIPVEDIQSLEWGEDVSSLHMARVSGTGMENLLKGNFVVEKDNNCRVFLMPSSECYIRIETADVVYYVNGGSAQETREVYDLLEDFQQ